VDVPFTFYFDKVYSTVAFKLKDAGSFECVTNSGEYLDCPNITHDLYMWGGNLNDIFSCTRREHEPPFPDPKPAFYIVPEAYPTVVDKFKRYVSRLNAEAQRGLYVGAAAVAAFCRDEHAQCVSNPGNFLSNAFPTGNSVMGNENVPPVSLRFSKLRTVVKKTTTFGTSTHIQSETTSITLETLHMSSVQTDSRGGIVFTAEPKRKERTLTVSPDAFTGFSRWFTMSNTCFGVITFLFLTAPKVPVHARWSPQKHQYSAALERHVTNLEETVPPAQAPQARSGRDPGDAGLLARP